MAVLKYQFSILIALSALITIGVFIFVLKPMVTNPVLDHVEKSCPVCSENKLSRDEKGVVVPIEQIASGMPIVLPQDDQNIIDYILSNEYILPPSVKAYNLTYPNTDPSKGQSLFIRKFLNNMTNGFFVECGALDGEARSNTLFMEMHLNWKGLLIEGDPKNFALIQTKNRKAWTSNTCLAVKPHPHKASFLQHYNIGRILNSEEATNVSKKSYVEVQCMPLFSLLAALNVTTVDYFSLDVEGSELKVLKTIPFDKVFIRTLSVEYVHTPEGQDELANFMKSKGYRVVGKVINGGQANDLMFAHMDVKLPQK